MSSPPKKVGTPIHSYVFQFSRMSANSFVCLPPKKKPEPQFIRMSSNSFICIPKKNSASQFLRLYSNSFVCLPIHSYVFQKKIEAQFIRMWVEGRGVPPPETLLLFRGNNNESKPIHYYYFREIIIMVRGGYCRAPFGRGAKMREMKGFIHTQFKTGKKRKKGATHTNDCPCIRRNAFEEKKV